MLKMNASPRVFWIGLAVSIAVAVLVWWMADSLWGAALVMGFVRVMFVPSRFRSSAWVFEKREDSGSAGLEKRA